MEFKQDTIGDIIESESQMILHGAECYGDYFINASEFNNLLNGFIKSVDDPAKFIAIAFIFQIRKYHTLALFSAIRRHHIQTSMNLRYVIEAVQWAAYAMGNEDQEKFCSKDSNGIISIEDSHEKAMYKWLDDNFKVKADETRRLKKMISGAGAHSNITYAFQNFEMKPFEDAGFKTTFFDPENDYWIKTDLWFVANTALGLLDLLYGVNQQFKVFKLIDDFGSKFKTLVDENNRLKTEMMNTENYKRAQALMSK
ncbi:MAG: hypothetical protein AABX72_03845 [Nanoarchaeota archaeon]